MAAEAACCLNPHLRVTPYTYPLNISTEHIFGDHFFTGVDGVAAALDSFESREYTHHLGAQPWVQSRASALLTLPLAPLPGRYVAARCTHYLKPLLEAGTLGTLGSASVFIPHVTEQYPPPPSAASAETAPYPVCTVRHFPSRKEHTVQVGRT